ncbi:hypothetical protein VST7929_01003 [Vibrio stylophorae]|uniref:DUF1800 domain-containing protein n=1 Tax=Vibrio stylophorae TaxID=659351 RepID=A0ABN8DUW3_9VIBR|nr:hypothetical protein [Vibrio stylophorae]CAH0533142.1 hypothetical protein VST7929_01003 [Vibrio stylophorae]
MCWIRKLLKFFGYLLLLLLIALIGLAIYVHGDEPLSREAQAIIERVEHSASQDDQAFFYQLGMHAPADKDPIDYGKALYAKELGIDVDESTIGDLQAHRESFRWERLQCFYSERASCFTEELLAAAKENVAPHAQFMARFWTLIALPDFMQMNGRDGIHLYEANSLNAGTHLVLQSILVQAENGQEVQAFAKLERLIALLRDGLSRTDYLISHGHIRVLLNLCLNFRHQFIYYYDVPAPPLVPMTLEERDYQRVMAYELTLFTRVIQADFYDNSSEIFWGIPFPRPVLNLLYKHNMTTNYIQYCHQEGMNARSQQSLEAYLAQPDEQWPVREKQMPVVKNLFGYIFGEMTCSENVWFPYIQKTRAVEIKILMSNAIHTQPVSQWVDAVKRVFPDQQVTMNDKYLCLMLPNMPEVEKVCLIHPNQLKREDAAQ